ncbi:MAG: XdhC family protein, partial [Granulosicoccaceae bacterium]
MLHPIDILQATSNVLSRAEPCVLATLVGVEGSSPRPAGSQMLIRADGSFEGMLSSGCVEQAIVGQALDALADGRARTLRYGKDSPWFDLQLPCGSGIDVQLCVNPDSTLVRDTLETLQKRKTVRWLLDQHGQWQRAQRPATEGHTQTFFPRWQLVAAGRGPMLVSLAAIAKSCDIEVHIFSPDKTDLEAAQPFVHASQQLSHADQFNCPPLDKHSAAVTLFHDHDWEPPVLKAMLATNTAYIAALGSPRAHSERLMELAHEWQISTTDEEREAAWTEMLSIHADQL